jgi:pseudouridine-5'-phosphate glycosidase
VSADLPELAMTSMAVVCAGAKAILDLPRTLEYLETAGVPVLGYDTDEFPAFYTASSGLPVDARVGSPEEVAALLRVKWELGLEGGVLVAVPPPEDAALDPDEVEAAVEAAQRAADKAGIAGGDLTPFMLAEIAALTEGRSLDANLALLERNARVGARIAAALNTIMAM